MAALVEATDGKIRDKPVNADLRELLIEAASAAKIDTVLVTSGGQAAKGSGGKRTGSTRHDHGRAADLQLLKNGRALDFTRSEDLPKIEAFVAAAAAGGATGIGAGVNYMGPKTLHVGFGSRSVWGTGGKAANAPAWLKQAVFAGWETPENVQKQETLFVDEDEKDGDRLRFAGTALPLKEKDKVLTAGYLGCELAALNAVIEVESRAKAFGKDRRPTILSEPHVFYRELGKGKERKEAAKLGLAYKRWKTRPYPKTQAARYDWLKKAAAINETAALRSCSWGIGQIMGFNHRLCGFDTVQEFVEAMTISEGAQLYAMARFIYSNHLHVDLRELDWKDFARGYNGAGYAKNAYHTKLNNAYRKRPMVERYVPSKIQEKELQALLLDVTDTATAATAPTKTIDRTGELSGERQIVIARDGLHLRAGNSTQFPVLRSLPFGQEVHVLERSDEWVQVDLHGDGKADGYMYAAFLKPVGEPLNAASREFGSTLDGQDDIDILEQISDLVAQLRARLN